MPFQCDTELPTMSNENDPESQRTSLEAGEPIRHEESLTTDSASNHQDKAEPANEEDPLTRQHVWDLALCLLAWGFTVANVTLVVGTSAVTVLSLDGDNESITSMPLGTFFVGSSFSGLAVTPWIFPQWGRKRGFLTGTALGLLATALGAVSVKVSSPALYIISTFFFGMANGIGFSLRFAAVEVVPSRWAARAVTLVVAGGVMAAIAGPESAAATRGAFGDDLTYIGVFLCTGIFNVCNAICMMLVTFPDRSGESNGATSVSPYANPQEVREMISRREFIVPVLVAVVGWSAMGMPMSLVRVVMAQLGYTTTDSLRVIELHFLGMYFPGFFTGNLIKIFGPKVICYASVVVFGAAQVIAFLPDEDESESIWLWSIGLILVGVAWNFAFTASTVWLLQEGRSDRKATLQAANDCLMFLFAGGWLFASSYIFEAGGSGLDGWYTLNWVVIGLNAFMAILLVLDAVLEKMNKCR